MQIISTRKDAHVIDIIELMVENDALFLAQGELVAPAFSGANGYALGLHIFRVLRKMRYKADKGAQRVKTPYRLLMSNSGDCKSYSVFAAAVLRSFGYACRYCFVNATGEVEPDHVFVQFEDETGATISLDATIQDFDSLPYIVYIWELNLPAKY